MKKITAFFATVGLVALLSTPIQAQPMGAPTAMAAPAAMPAPIMRAAPMAPAMRAPAMRPAPRPAARPAAMPVAMAPAMATAPAAMPAPAMVAAMAPAAPNAMAPAAPAAKKDSKGSVVGGWILEIILYLLGAFLAAFIPVFTAWLYKKLKLTDLQHKDMIDGVVLKASMFGIGKAEEAAHKLKDNPMDGAKKLDLAVSSANRYLRDSGLPEKGADYLADVIESALGLNRPDGNGKSKVDEKPEEEPEEKPAEKKDDKKKKSDK